MLSTPSRKALISAPIIQPPDWSLSFEIMCDASDYAIGAIPGHTKNRKHHTIAYASKMLIGAQLSKLPLKKSFLQLFLLLINSDLT
jgi:hypothetical protein